MRESVSIAAQALVRAADHRLESSPEILTTDDDRSARLAALRVARDHVDHAHGDAETDGHAPVLRHLAHVFELSDAEVDVLGVVAAVEVDDRLAALADLLTGGSTGRPSVGLALEVARLGTGGAAGAAVLGPTGRLRTSRLLVVEGGASTRLRQQVRLSEPVLGHLLGVHEVGPLLAPYVRETVAVPGRAAREIALALEEGTRLVWVRGPDDGPGVSQAVSAFISVGVPSLVVDLAHVPTRVPVDELVATAALEAALLGRGLVLTGLDHAHGHPEPWARAAVLAEAASVAESVTVPVVVVSTSRWHHGWTVATPGLVEVGPLDADERREVWVAATGLSADELTTLATVQLSPEQVRAAVDHADLLRAAGSGGLDDHDGATDPLLAAARALELSRPTPSVMEHPSRARLSLSDLVLPPAGLADIERVVRWGRIHQQLSATSATPYNRSSKGTGLSVLMTGSPGTGKTLAGHVIADELGLEVMQVSLSSTVDKYIGETEKNLERVFAAAEARHVLLFFDEADALFGSRSEVKEAKDRYANQEVSYLLQRLEYFNGMVLLATNYRGNIDKAFMRRIQLVVSFPDPDEPTRRRLWEAHLDVARGFDADDAPELAMLSSLELSGGDIRNICLGAIYDSLSRDETLGMRHLLASSTRELRKQGRLEPPELATRTSSPPG